MAFAALQAEDLPYGAFSELGAASPQALRLAMRDFDSTDGQVSGFAADESPLFSTRAELLQAALPCFTAASVISTAAGPRQISALRAGERVITRDHGLQEVLWVGKRSFGWRALGLNPLLRPIELSASQFSGASFARDHIVSPNHRILLRERGEEWLTPAANLLGRAGVRRCDAPQVTYYQVMTSRHELLLVDEVWSESYHATVAGLRALEPSARAELAQLLPDLSSGLADYAPVRADHPSQV